MKSFSNETHLEQSWTLKIDLNVKVCNVIHMGWLNWDDRRAGVYGLDGP